MHQRLSREGDRQGKRPLWEGDHQAKRPLWEEVLPKRRQQLLQEEALQEKHLPLSQEEHQELLPEDRQALRQRAQS